MKKLLLLSCLCLQNHNILKISLIIIFICFSSIVVNAQPFIKGYYYDNTGQKKSGLIRFSPELSNLHIKESKEASSNKIKIGDISAIVMEYGGLTGNDSLTVLTENGKDDKRYFAKFMFATLVTRFYSKFVRTQGGGVPSMSSMSVPSSTTGQFHSINRWSTSSVYFGTEQLTMYQEGNTTYELTKRNYIDVLSKAFADVPDLVQELQNKKYKFNKLGDIFYQYQSRSNYKGQ